MDITTGSIIPVSSDMNHKRMARSYWRASYETDYKYVYGQDPNGAPILWQMTGEQGKDTANYTRRLSRAYVQPYVKSVVDKYVAFCVRQPAVRPVTPDWYTSFLQNVDGDDTTITEFMTMCLTKAFVDQGCYILVNNTNDGEDALDSQAAEAIEPRLCTIDPDSILYIDEEYGCINEILYLTGEHDSTSQDGKTSTLSAVYMNEDFIMDVTLGKTAALSSQKNSFNYTITSIDSQTENVYGSVPVVKLDVKLTIAAHIADGQRQVLNNISLLQTGANDTIFNQMVVLGVDDINEVSKARGSDTILGLPTGADIKYVAPPAETIEQLLNLCKWYISTIWAISGIGQTEPNQVESGVAKAYKFDELNVNMATICKSAQKAENKIIKLISAGLSLEYPGNCEYPKDVAIPILEEDLKNTLTILGSALPAIIKQKQTSSFAGEHYDFDDVEKKVLAEQLAQIGEPVTPPAV